MYQFSSFASNSSLFQIAKSGMEVVQLFCIKFLFVSNLPKVEVVQIVSPFDIS